MHRPVAAYLKATQVLAKKLWGGPMSTSFFPIHGSTIVCQTCIFGRTVRAKVLPCHLCHSEPSHERTFESKLGKLQSPVLS